VNRVIAAVLSGAGLIAAGAAGAGLLGVGVATGAVTTSTPATFQMYANVDAEGDLGSHYDALRAGIFPGSTEYFVKFKKPIGHCAAVVEIGKAGGSDDSTPASPIVVPGGLQSFHITFEQPNPGGGTQLMHEPFMMIVTCRR
jgi:hypothetical protein